jgi:hypothetical protein
MSATQIVKRILITGGNPEERYPVPSVDQFKEKDDENLLLDFIPAPDLQEIATALIRERDCFAELEGVEIHYRWKREGGKSQGRATFGKCIKTSGLVKHYSEASFIIWAAADWCLGCQFTRWQMEALIFHELKHAGIKVNDEGQEIPRIVGHDWEGFAQEIHLYGAWFEPLQSIERAFKGLPLLDYAEEQDASTSKLRDLTDRAEQVLDKIIEHVEERAASGLGVPTISVDLDKSCKKCGEAGATQNGHCLKCTTEMITGRKGNGKAKESAEDKASPAPFLRKKGGRKSIDAGQ